MKNLILLFTLILIAKSSFAQFELTPNGFVDKSNKEKDYIVLNFEGKSKVDLYKKSLVFLNKLYVSPKNVISAVEGEAISINGVEKNSIRRTGMHRFSNNYTVSFEFKDGKIKVNAPGFKLTSFAAGHEQTLYLVYSGFSIDGSEFGIYSKKGELKNEKAKNDLETFFNTYLTNLETELNSKSDNW
ncbi:MAG: hypothetical protein WBP45_13235 [Daejeonella sp.]